MKKRTRLSIFKDFTLKWWQGGLFKWGVFALGIVAGAYWHNFFEDYLVVLIIIALPSLAYITYVWWKQ